MTDPAPTTRKIMKMLTYKDTVSCADSEDLNESTGKLIICLRTLRTIYIVVLFTAKVSPSFIHLTRTNPHFKMIAI